LDVLYFWQDVGQLSHWYWPVPTATRVALVPLQEQHIPERLELLETLQP
jgi:hypothetical protein